MSLVVSKLTELPSLAFFLFEWSDPRETTDYGESSTEESDTNESDGGYTTESEPSELQEDNEESNGEKEEHEEAVGGKEDEKESSGMSPRSRASAEDIYARTVVRFVCARAGVRFGLVRGLALCLVATCSCVCLIK